MQRSDAVKITAMLVAGFPVPAWPKETQSLYAEMFLDLDAELTKRAALEWIRTHDRSKTPAISDIRRAVAELQAAPVPFLAVEDAWAFVEKCFTTHGRSRKFPPEHPLVARAVATMGWEELCKSENLMADRAHFRQIYASLLERGLCVSAKTPGARPTALPEIPRAEPDQPTEERPQITETAVQRVAPKLPVFTPRPTEPRAQTDAELTERKAALRRQAEWLKAKEGKS